MKKTKYKIYKRVGDLFYIYQLNEDGIPEAAFKGYLNYQKRYFTLYPNMSGQFAYSYNVDGVEKKIVNECDVIWMDE